MEKKIMEHMEKEYPGWANKMKLTGVYLKFVSEYASAKGYTAAQIFTAIAQEYQTYDDNYENLN